MPPISMAALICLTLPPPAFVSVASAVGYDMVGLRLLPAAPGGVAHDLIGDRAMRRETLARLADTGLSVLDVEIIRLQPGVRPEASLALFEVAQELGARAVLIAGDDEDRGRLIAGYAALCEAARPFGLTLDLEYMPWTAVATARDALAVVEAAGQPNGGVLVDALHTERSATTLADVAAIPARYLHYWQACDAPGPTPTEVEALIHTAREERLLPGEGVIDVAGLARTMPAELPVSVEIPSRSRAAMGPEAWARTALESVRVLFS